MLIKRIVYFLRGFWTAKRFAKASRSKVESYQQKKLNKLLTKVSHTIPYYHSYTGQELNTYPIIDKKQFLHHFAQINRLGLSLQQCETHALTAEHNRNFSPQLKGISVGLSSGTSQRRGVFMVSQEEQAQWAGYIIAKNIPFTFKQTKVALFLRANSNLYEASNGKLIQFRFFDLTIELETLMGELEKFSPDILIAPAHVLGMIAQHKPGIHPSKIISVAEVLEDATRKQVEHNFQQPVYEIYQATEGYLASTCKHGSLHLNEDIVIIEKEWLCRESGRFIPIITDLNRHTLPIIRYRLDDVLIEDPRPCACGSSFTRLKKIEGRTDDMLWLTCINTGKLKSVFPDLIRRAMYLGEHPIDDYTITQENTLLHIHYDGQQPEKIPQQIHTYLTALFSSLHLHPPDIHFSHGVTHTITQKRRRISCKQKPFTEAATQ